MRSLRVFGAMALCLGLWGCKPAFDIRLASEGERIPTPSFVIEEREARGERPRYHTVRVLELPDNDLVWHLRAEPFGQEASQAALRYGSTPEGFEAVQAAAALQPGSDYAIIVSGTAHGQLKFRVDADGAVRAND